MSERSGVWSHVADYEVADFMSLINKAEEVMGHPVKGISFLAGGLTNKSYKLTFEDTDEAVVMRLSGKGTGDYIDRAGEKHNCEVVGKLGFAPKMYYFEADTGCSIAEFISLPPMHASDFIEKKDVQIAMGKVVKEFHTSGAEFIPDFDPVALTLNYFKLADEVNFEYKKYYPEFDKTLDALQRIDATLKEHPMKPGAVHCDLLAENFMYDGKDIKIIDWEYGGQYAPMYEVGGPITEAFISIDSETAENYLEAYFGHKATDDEKAVVLVNMFLYCTYWSAWSWVQMATGGKDPAVYVPYGTERAEVGTEYMHDPRFEKGIEILAEGRF